VSTLIPQHYVDAQNASSQQLFGFSTKLFNGFEKLVALNLQAVKAAFAENQAIMGKALPSTPAELFALSASLTTPAAEKVAHTTGMCTKSSQTCKRSSHQQRRLSSVGISAMPKASSIISQKTRRPVAKLG
jgi:phasin family protein